MQRCNGKQDANVRLAKVSLQKEPERLRDKSPMIQLKKTFTEFGENSRA